MNNPFFYASYTTGLEVRGRKTILELELTANCGENIYLYGSPKRRQIHFEILCMMRQPDQGFVSLPPEEPYSMTDTEAAAFRRDNLGALPENGGLIPELPMLPQVALPMRLAGESDGAIAARIQELCGDRMPLHSLYDLPTRCNPRRQAYAAIFRALIRKPRLLVINGFLDEWDELDADLLWDALLSIKPKECTLLYLSGAPAPVKVQWNQKRKL